MKFPPHILSTGERLMWLLDAGGLVAQVPRTKVLECTRCHVTSEPIASTADLGTFLHQHCGATCPGPTPSTKPRARRSA